jgi:hypothetical protein
LSLSAVMTRSCRLRRSARNATRDRRLPLQVLSGPNSSAASDRLQCRPFGPAKLRPGSLVAARPVEAKTTTTNDVNQRFLSSFCSCGDQPA